MLLSTLQCPLATVDTSVTPSYASKGMIEWPSAICRKIIANNEHHSHEMPGDLPFIFTFAEIPFLLQLAMLQTLGHLRGVIIS